LSGFTGLSLLYFRVTVMNNFCFESYVSVVGLAVLLLCFEIFVQTVGKFAFYCRDSVV